MKVAIAFIAVLLAGCSDPEGSTNSAPEPAVTPAASVELPKQVSDSKALESAGLQTLRVVGTEPFWGVRVDGDALTFTTPADQTGLRMRGIRSPVPSGGLDISGHRGEQAFSLLLRPAVCSDGMSDTAFTMTAEFHIGEATYRGCANAVE